MQRKQQLLLLAAALNMSCHSNVQQACASDSLNVVLESSSAQDIVKLADDDASGVKGKEGSCKGKEASCKGKEGKAKGKDASCKGKEGSCKGKESSCKGKEGSCKAKSE
jgi:hypothetical protein